MRIAITLILLASALPVLGWGASLIFHFCQFGQFFVWNDMAYAPLLIVTFPMEAIYDQLNIRSHVAMFAYALFGGVVYALTAALVLSPILIHKGQGSRKQ